MESAEQGERPTKCRRQEPDGGQYREVEVSIVGCGQPRRGMGWFHAQQLLDGQIPGARLAYVVEPWLLTGGRRTQAGEDFASWSQLAETRGTEVVETAAAIPVIAEGGVALAVICGRTHDNPQLLSEILGRGTSTSRSLGRQQLMSYRRRLTTQRVQGPASIWATCSSYRDTCARPARFCQQIQQPR